jgi:TolB-like protein
MARYVYGASLLTMWFWMLFNMGVDRSIADTARIAVLPFHGNGVDANLSFWAEERTKEIIEDDNAFELIPASEIKTQLGDNQDRFLGSRELRSLMNEVQASLIIEGSLERTAAQQTNIQIRISARSSSWRPPTTLSATGVSPEYALPRTEALVREFLRGYSGEQSMERFFQSALIPGLGQYKEGCKTKAGIFLLGTSGFLLGSSLLPDGDPYTGNGKVETRQFPGDPIRWYIGDRAVSQEEAMAEMKHRAEAAESRDDAQFTKRLFIGAGIALYAINLYDILKIIRRYDTDIGGNLSLKLNPLSSPKIISIACHFNL